ncbi:sterol desaturase family protein [Paenibacillus sp. y28]|uniref:sterol desaturase family protein n=1 Tax=Paenibacillus sp. y28 TaxID=3129110 RepID=UPI003016ADDC
MHYAREFISHRLIRFLLLLWLVFGGNVLISAPLTMHTGAAWLSGIAVFLLIEYAAHRFILHQFPRLAPAAYRGHVAHHQMPSDSRYLFGPAGYDLAGYAVLTLISWAVTWSWPLAAAVVSGALTCQLYYQWMHFVSHRPIVPKTRWGKWMKRKHLLHHHLDEEAWYGVSNPMLDILLGTNESKKLTEKQMARSGSKTPDDPD